LLKRLLVAFAGVALSQSNVSRLPLRTATHFMNKTPQVADAIPLSLYVLSKKPPRKTSAQKNSVNPAVFWLGV
jgi:hypothetical protein